MLVGSSTPCPFRLIPPPRSHSFFSGVSDATIYTLTCFLCNRCLGRGAEFRERRDRVHIETNVLSSVFSGHLRQGYCTVSHDNFIYFIGGGERYPNMSSVIRIVSNVDRYLIGMTFTQISETNVQTLKWLDPHNYLLSAKGLWFAKQA